MTLSKKRTQRLCKQSEGFTRCSRIGSKKHRHVDGVGHSSCELLVSTIPECVRHEVPTNLHAAQHYHGVRGYYSRRPRTIHEV